MILIRVEALQEVWVYVHYYLLSFLVRLKLVAEILGSAVPCRVGYLVGWKYRRGISLSIFGGQFRAAATWQQQGGLGAFGFEVLTASKRAEEELQGRLASNIGRSTLRGSHLLDFFT